MATETKTVKPQEGAGHALLELADGNAGLDVGLPARPAEHRPQPRARDAVERLSASAPGADPEVGRQAALHVVHGRAELLPLPRRSRFTGLLLMFYYRPTLEYAYTDIVGLREHVPLGIMREMHRWGAHAMVITVWLHMFRVFMTGLLQAAARVQLERRRHHAGADAAAVVHGLPAAVGPAGHLGHHGRLEHGARDAVPRPRRARRGAAGARRRQADSRGATMRGSRCSAARSSARARCCGSTCCTASGLPLGIAVLMAVHFWRVRKDGGISGPAVGATRPTMDFIKGHLQRSRRPAAVLLPDGAVARPDGLEARGVRLEGRRLRRAGLPHAVLRRSAGSTRTSSSSSPSRTTCRSSA